MSNTSFNDLNNQLSINQKQNSEAPTLVSASSNNVAANNQSTLFRGYSRSSANKGMIGTVASSLNAYIHPGTSESKKRQLPSVNSHNNSQLNARLNQNPNNSSLPSKKQTFQKQQLEYVPIKTLSYASQRNNSKNITNQNTEFIYESKISDLPLNNSNLISGVGSLSVLNHGLINNQQFKISDSKEFQGDSVIKMDAQMKYNEIQNAQFRVYSKSKSNNNLGHKSQSQVPNLNSRKEIQEFNDIQMGKFNQNQIKQQNQIRQSQSNTEANDKNQKNNSSPKNSRFAVGQQLSNINVNVDESLGGNGGGMTTFQINSNGQHQQTESLGNMRKMSLAAKAGQMQIFSNMNPSQTNLDSQVNQNFQGQNNVIDMLKQKQLSVHPSKPPAIPSHSQLLANNSQIPPPSSLGLQGQLSRESYLQRRQLVQQQREKKQEMLKQIEQNGGRGGSYAATSTIPSKLYNGMDDKSIELDAAQARALMGSGSQFQLNSPSLNYLNNNGHMNLATNSFQEKKLNQSIVINSKIEENSNQIQVDQSPSRFHRAQLSLQSETDPNLPNRRRLNALSMPMDHQTTSLPTSTINSKHQNMKFRASELQQHQIIITQSPEQMSGISGKQISLQNGQNSASISYSNPLSYVANESKSFNEPIIKQGQLKVLQEINKDTNYPTPDQNVNNRITRKLEGGRPHKVYDYMFIQMSNEQFRNEYDNKKIFVQKSFKDDYAANENEQSQNKVFKSKFLSPNKNLDRPYSKNHYGLQSPASQNLNGLVKIKAYDSQVTDELPIMQCNLLPTQLDHVKLLICEQEDKNYPKLTQDAANRFEIEKQNQIKQYMEDIIIKLQQKDRKFKVTVKRKFVEDALYNSTSIRVASVYVIVVNREKTYDPLLNQRLFKSRKNTNDQNQLQDTSDEEEDIQSKEVGLVLKMNNENIEKKFPNPNLMNHAKKRSMYESDTNGAIGTDNLNSTAASSNTPQFKKLLQDKSNNDAENKFKSIKSKPISTGPSFKRQFKDDFGSYKYVLPVKEFPAKYGPTKIRIIQDISAHDHHKKHTVNTFFNQYNDFIKLVFKNQKNSGNSKLNTSYLFGLARALGLTLKKDSFSEQNMKSREHINTMKEKLIYAFWKKLNDENKDVTPVVEKLSIENSLTQNESEIDGVSIDSGISTNNNATPKSKGIILSKENENEKSDKQEKADKSDNKVASTAMTLPQTNVIYKYFIGKGNNSIMVRSLFKNRFWWVQNDSQEMEKCNFCWTQIKVQKLMDVLSCKFPDKKSGGKNNGFKQLLATPICKSNKKKKQNQQNSEKNIGSKQVQQSNGNSEFLEQKLYNKIEDNFHMNNKKALYLNMKNYYEALDQDVFDNLPLTFHIKNGLDDPEFQRFKQYYNKSEEEIKVKKALQKQRKKDERERQLKDKEENTLSQSPLKKSSKDKDEEPVYYQSQMPMKNIWIIKPGENTNRGQGIQVAKDFNEIRDIIEDSTVNRRRTCIVQKYIHNPLLIHKRKFDIRTFALFTSQNGNMKAYLYEEGYLRTSSREYSINNLSNKLVHLTNDAVQKRSEDYGKFEPGNKLSYNDFQQFIDKNYPDLNICFERDLLPQMNKMTVDIFRACHGKLDPKRRLHSLEVFGLDFMIDDEFKPYLIEVNTNPCLELSSPLLARLIPNMLENSLKVGLDPIFLPPENFSTKKAFIGDSCPENRFQLCYDERVDGPVLDKLFKTKENVIVEMEEDEFSDDEDVHDEDE